MFEHRRGTLIAFMGLDGCGKSTHAARLSQVLKAYEGKTVHVLHGYEPRKHIHNLDGYVKAHNEEPLKILLPNNRSAALILDLWENVEYKIKPWIQNGDIVILESYYYNSLAFAPLLGADTRLIHDLIGILPVPDLTVYLSLTPKQSWERVNVRHASTGMKIKLKEQPEYLEKAYQIYQSLKTNENVITVDAWGTFEEVDNQINSMVKEKLNV